MEEPQYVKLKMTLYGLDLDDMARIFSHFRENEASIKRTFDIAPDEPKKTYREERRLLKKELKLMREMIEQNSPLFT